MLGKWKNLIEGIGIVAVIVSVLFVAYEIRQNNELMAAQDRYNRLTALTSNIGSHFANSDLALISSKSRSGLELLPEEEIALTYYNLQTNYIREWTFYELPENELPNELWKLSFRNPSTLNRWNETKNVFGDEFVRYIDERIIGH